MVPTIIRVDRIIGTTPFQSFIKQGRVMDRPSGIIRGYLLAALLLSWSCTTVSGAETFGYTSRKPQRWETPGPWLENEPGRNTYWHDPYLGNWEMCRAWPPSTNGYAPNWYARGEMLGLFRHNYDAFSFATLGPSGPVALSTADFRSEFRAGVRALIGKSLSDWYRIEFSYIGSYNWSDIAAVRNDDDNDQGGQGNLYSPFTNFGDPTGQVGLDYNRLASIRLRSRLDNGELNVRRRLLMRPGSYETSFLIGARFLEISENFDYQSLSSLPGPLDRTLDVGTDTSNEMIGLQIGLQGQFLVQPRMWVDCEIKGGIFQNQAGLRREFTVSEVDGDSATINTGDQADRTSFVGDISLQFNYHFAPAWTFTAGYNVIWVTGVALGANNFEDDISLLALGPAYIDHGGQLVYHGPSFGLVFSW
jgi:hypothetical protein